MADRNEYIDNLRRWALGPLGPTEPYTHTEPCPKESIIKLKDLAPATDDFFEDETNRLLRQLQNHINSAKSHLRGSLSFETIGGVLASVSFAQGWLMEADQRLAELRKLRGDREL